MMQFSNLRRRLALWLCPDLRPSVSPAVVEFVNLAVAEVAAMETKHLSDLAELYATHIGRSLYTVASRVGVHNKAFTKLRDGLGCHVETYRHAMAWFAVNWPADLEWPHHIPRPSKSKKEAA